VANSRDSLAFSGPLRHALLLVQIPLKTRKHFADFVGLAQVGEGVWE